MTDREAMLALAEPEPDEPLYGNPAATARRDAWNRRRIKALRHAQAVQQEHKRDR